MWPSLMTNLQKDIKYSAELAPLWIGLNGQEKKLTGVIQ